MPITRGSTDAGEDGVIGERGVVLVGVCEEDCKLKQLIFLCHMKVLLFS